MELVNDFKEITEKVDLRPCEQFFTAMSITNHNFMRKITLVNDELHDLQYDISFEEYKEIIIEQILGNPEKQYLDKKYKEDLLEELNKLVDYIDVPHQYFGSRYFSSKWNNCGQPLLDIVKTLYYKRKYNEVFNYYKENLTPELQQEFNSLRTAISDLYIEYNDIEFKVSGNHSSPLGELTLYNEYLFENENKVRTKEELDKVLLLVLTSRHSTIAISCYSYGDYFKTAYRVKCKDNTWNPVSKKELSNDVENPSFFNIRYQYICKEFVKD